jgi:hypothetical protein
VTDNGVHAVELTVPPLVRRRYLGVAASYPRCFQMEVIMSLGTILLIILILLLIGALPSWPYSSGWGYYPSGGLGLVVIIILILLLLGRL